MLNKLATDLRAAFLEHFAKHPFSTCRLFLSASDMRSRAITRHACAPTAAEAWDKALTALSTALNEAGIIPTILRADWVVAAESLTWKEWQAWLATRRLGFCRYGLALDKDYLLAFTEQELNAHVVLMQDEDAAKLRDDSMGKASFNATRAGELCRQRFGRPWPVLQPRSRVERFACMGVFVENGKKPMSISGTGTDTGLRDIDPLHERDVLGDVAERAGRRLMEFCGKDGKFKYCIMPCSTESTEGYYNTLRHLGTVYAMLQCFERRQDTAMQTAIHRAIDYAINMYLVRKPLPNGTYAAFFKNCFRNDIHIGGNGIALMLFCKYTQVFATEKFLPLMHELARGILESQQADGSFDHVLDSRSFACIKKFCIVYYDGEAVLGLLRLYRITHVATYLEAVERAFARFIETDHWQHADHWLSYAADELTAIKPEQKYFDFGLKNLKGRIHRIVSAEITAPTRLEQIMAGWRLVQRMGSGDINPRLLELAMRQRAHMQLTGFFWPETAMFFSQPQQLLDTFFIRYNAFRIRIDEIQHTISGILAWLDADIQALPQQQATHAVPQAYTFTGANSTVLFLLKEVLEKPVGIEVGAMLRADLFRHHFQCPVQLCTWMYQPFATEIFATQVAQGRFVGAQLANMYDFFQGIDRVAPAQDALEHWELSPDWHLAEAANPRCERVINRDGETVIYRAFDTLTGKLRYVNHLAAGKIIRRDRYDPLGFLSMTAFLDTTSGKPQHCVYFRQDGSPALLEYFDIKQGKAELTAMHVLNRHGQTVAAFTSLRAAIDYWFSMLTKDASRTYIAIADRREEYAEVFRTAALPGHYANVRIVQMVHSNHLVANTHLSGEGDLLTTGVKRAYDYFSAFDKRADAIVTLTERQRAHIEQRFGLTHVFTIPHALPEAHISEPVVFKPHRVVMAGRLHSEKGHDMALDAWKIVLRSVPDATLHFCGQGNLLEHLKKRVAMEGLVAKVVFEGYRDDMPAFFAGSALSICTSTFEGFNLAIMESLQQGCPVISVDCNYGPAEQIVDGVNGFLVPPGDVDTLAGCITRVLLNPDIREHLSKGCKETLVKFNQQTVAASWNKLFNWILQ